MPLNETTVDTISVNNLKTLGEMHDVQLYRQRENALSHDQRMDKYAEIHFASHSERASTVDNAEAFAGKQLFTGDVIGEKGMISSFVAALAQIMSKQGNNTPPQTGDVK